MQDPRGIVVYEHRVFVVETGNHRVQVFDVNGHTLALWGSWGRAPGQFRDPRRATLAEGLLFVLDVGNRRVQAFQLDGTITHTIPVDEDTTNFGPLVTVDHMLMLHAGNRLGTPMRCFDLDGTFLTQWPLSSSYAAVAVSPRGKLLVDNGDSLVTMHLDGTCRSEIPFREPLYAFALHGKDLYVVSEGNVFIQPLLE
jgi:DNA-binding beta-propeller fold protein YncE